MAETKIQRYTPVERYETLRVEAERLRVECRTLRKLYEGEREQNKELTAEGPRLAQLLRLLLGYYRDNDEAPDELLQKIDLVIENYFPSQSDIPDQSGATDSAEATPSD